MIIQTVYHIIFVLMGIESLTLQTLDISSGFQKDRQEDAHEFLQCMLDRLDTCFPKPNGNDGASYSDDNNIVNEVFGGRLRSQV